MLAPARPAALLFVAVVVSAMTVGPSVLMGHLLFASSYYMWWGGWAIGPRVLLPAAPLAALGADMLGPRWTPVVLSVAALSIAS